MPDLQSVFEDKKIIKEVKEGDIKVVAKIVSLIDDVKRVNQLQLAVKKFTVTSKIGYSDLRQMILSLDDSVLGFDDFSNLKSIAPTKEEIDKVKQSKDDPQEFDIPTRWIFEMKDVPNFETRIDNFIFKKEFESDFNSSYIL